MAVDVAPSVVGGVEFVGREFYLFDSGRTETIARVDSEGGLVLCSGASVSGTDGVALPAVGESVAISHGDGVLEGYWAGLARSPGVGTGAGMGDGSADRRVAVLVVAGGEVLERVCPVGAVAAGRVVTGGVEPGTVAVLRALASTREQADRQRWEQETWKAEFAAAACDRADEHDMCAEFDEFMQAWGLPGRARTWTVVVELSARVFVDVDALTAEDAEQNVTREDVETAISAAGPAGLNALDYHIRYAE